MISFSIAAESNEQGRVIIPKEVRKILGISGRSHLIFLIEDNNVRLITRKALSKELRGAFADKSGKSLAAELSRERRTEAKQKW